MFLRDYKIVISTDINDHTYWLLFRKGELKKADREELSMVCRTLEEILCRIRKNL